MRKALGALQKGVRGGAYRLSAAGKKIYGKPKAPIAAPALPKNITLVKRIIKGVSDGHRITKELDETAKGLSDAEHVLSGRKATIGERLWGKKYADRKAHGRLLEHAEKKFGSNARAYSYAKKNAEDMKAAVRVLEERHHTFSNSKESKKYREKNKLYGPNDVVAVDIQGNWKIIN